MKFQKEYNQNIIIENVQYKLLISNISHYQYKFIIYGNNVEYANFLYDSDTRLDRLESALLNKNGLSINYKIFNNRLELTLQHSLFTLYDKFFLYTFHKSFMDN